MEPPPSHVSTLEFIQRDVRRHVSVLENATSTEQVIPELKQFLEKLKSINLQSVSDPDALQLLTMLFIFSSSAVANYAPPELRKEIEEFESKVRAHAWEVFVNERKSRGVENPDAIPSTFDKDFGPYMVAMHLYTSTPEEAIRRANEVFRKIVDEDLPSDSEVVDAISQQIKDLTEVGYQRLASSLPDRPNTKDLPKYDEYMALALEARRKVSGKQQELMHSGKA